jgi:predicted nucleic acid-binding protein
MLTHLLDTSAWIAHLQREPGWDVVSELLGDPQTQVGVSTLSLVELHAQMRSGGREDEFTDVVDDYRELFSQIASFDETIALLTVSLRQSAETRVPAVDAMIAATAAHHGAILVHRDPHFLTIPGNLLRQKVLADDA